MEERRHPRFSFQQPVLIKLQAESGWHELQGITENVSTEGIFLTTYSLLSVGAEVDLTLALPHNVRVTCHGQVMRVEPHVDEGKVRVAVRCASPFAEMPISRSAKLSASQSG